VIEKTLERTKEFEPEIRSPFKTLRFFGGDAHFEKPPFLPVSVVAFSFGCLQRGEKAIIWHRLRVQLNVYPGLKGLKLLVGEVPSWIHLEDREKVEVRFSVLYGLDRFQWTTGQLDPMQA
jgi:hypothetical protein